MAIITSQTIFSFFLFPFCIFSIAVVSDSALSPQILKIQALTAPPLNTHFHSCSFLTFQFKFYLYIKFNLSSKDNLLLIYTFMCMIIFLRIIILSYQRHQICLLSAVLGMAWNRDGLSCIKFILQKSFYCYPDYHIEP